MKDILTKLGLMAGLLGSVALGATGTASAKPHHVARSVEQAPYNYTCQSSWYYPGYYCYVPGSSNWSYDWYPSYYAYNGIRATTRMTPMAALRPSETARNGFAGVLADPHDRRPGSKNRASPAKAFEVPLPEGRSMLADTG
jgi:hypothetical protein